MPQPFAPTFAPRPAAASVPLPARGLDDRSVDDPLVLPAPWTPPSRPPVPILASVVPVVGAVGLWLVTGSVLSLWLAALGPLIAGATLLDAARGARRDRRRARADAARARDQVARAVERSHDAERERRWATHPQVAGLLDRDQEIWRPVPGRENALVAAAGLARSGTRVTGGSDDAADAALRARAQELTGAPIVVPASAGIAVVGAPVVAAAVARGLALQLCLTLPPGELRISGALQAEHAWAEQLPHRAAVSGATLALGAPGEPVSADADMVIVRVEPGHPLPPRCGVVLVVDAPDSARIDYGGQMQEATVEAIGADQAALIAQELAERAGRTLGIDPDVSRPVLLAPLIADAPRPVEGGLAAVIGLEGGAPRLLDLVADGPHAIVAGVTGSGKSELLVTWILALCATHSTREVSFLLADFKGGTAFDALAGIPHVTGVITDLDGAGSRRAIESLRAEVRWREAELARAGARDIRDPRVDIPRLVIVVDEFAALLGDHPELHAVFTDLAARGRALGMHLVLGTQRPAGVVRESLLANCPLRISLRVTDAGDSRAVIGIDEAASLPGGVAGRGIALVRTAADSAPRRVRIALSAPDDARAVIAAADGPSPRRPWLPELPSRIDLVDLVRVPDAPADTLLLGLADEPDHQRQRPVGVSLADRGLLVVGAAGSGKTTALATLASQASAEVITVPATGEGAWDAVAGLVDTPPAAGSIVVLDDLDAVATRLPYEYAHEILERIQHLVRGAGDAGILVVASAQRLAGPAARVADLLPRRLVLATGSRAEHIAAGGDPAQFAPSAPAGRGRLDGLAIQVASVPERARPSQRLREPWTPRAALTGLVARRSPSIRTALTEWERRGAMIRHIDEYVADPALEPDSPVVVVGDADEWQRHWRVLTGIRADHDLVIDASCAGEFRLLTGDRTLPPYCEPGRARAWLMSAGGAPGRIRLPERVTDDRRDS